MLPGKEPPRRTPRAPHRRHRARVGRLAALFRLVGDPTRARLLLSLLEGERTVSDLAADAGVSISAVSHQLRLLKEHGWVRCRREGRCVWCSLDDEHVRDLLCQGLAHVEHAGPAGRSGQASRERGA